MPRCPRSAYPPIICLPGTPLWLFSAGTQFLLTSGFRGHIGAHVDGFTVGYRRCLAKEMRGSKSSPHSTHQPCTLSAMPAMKGHLFLTCAKVPWGPVLPWPQPIIPGRRELGSRRVDHVPTVQAEPSAPPRSHPCALAQTCGSYLPDPSTYCTPPTAWFSVSPLVYELCEGRGWIPSPWQVLKSM